MLMPDRWCTVDGHRRRRTAAQPGRSGLQHLRRGTPLCDARQTEPERHCRRPTLATVFEVVIGGRVNRVEGAALQRWIVQRRQDWKGPKGLLFRERPMLDSKMF